MIFEGLVRETKEETDLGVASERIIYAREIISERDYLCNIVDILAISF